ncbi:MAG TPA: transglycosylase domain-containing protein [Ktedonobacterales bacterium]
MSMTHTLDHTPSEEHKPASPSPAQQLSYPDDIQPEPDRSAMPETPARPSQAPVGPALTLRPGSCRSRRSAAAWRRRKREFLRHRQHREKQQTRATIVSFTLSALSPFALLLTMIAGLLGVGLYYYQSQQSALAHIASDFPNDSLKIYDAQGNLIDELGDQGLQTTLPLNQIAKVLQNATIAIEDKDFWTNQGVDFLAVVRAAIDDLRSGQIVSGASTITQQLIKNALLGPEVTLDRKLREMVLAMGLSHQMSKQDILSLYLNTIFYGEQSYGIDAAAHTFFSLNDQPGKSAAAQLDLAQASLLAGLPRSPSDLDPLDNLPDALARQQAVLGQMVIQGYITEARAEQAEAEASQPGFLKPSAPTNLAPQFSSYVLQQVQTLIDQHALSTGDLSRSGLRIYTTLNITLQNQILQIARQHIEEMAAAHNMSNAAVVLIDYHTGAILTLLGSIDYNNAKIDGQFDVATDGWRQPGSSFKPFVYATAFEKGWSPGTPIVDKPISIPIPGQPNYAPQNYDGRFHGVVTLRQALQNSFNVPAVKTLMFAGIQDSLQTAEEMGITGYEGVPGYSMVLGGLDVKLIDETSAYGVFGNNGVRVPPFAIQTITDTAGKVLYQHTPLPGTQVISPQIAGLMTNVLSDDKARQYEFGVCSPLMLYDGQPYSAACQRNPGVVRPAAVKTGTTSDFKDNWTVGYTTDFVLGVWAGNDDGSPMYNVSGVDGAAPIWHDAMLAAEQDHPIQNFVLPHGLIYATVRYTHRFTSTDWYLPGTVPTNAIILGQS